MTKETFSKIKINFVNLKEKQSKIKTSIIN